MNAGQDLSFAPAIDLVCRGALDALGRQSIYPVIIGRASNKDRAIIRFYPNLSNEAGS
jgi:hypothetical protein